MAFFDDLLAVAKQRRAAKSFNEKDIPEETLKNIFEFMNTAPSSMGLEEWKVINVRRNSPYKQEVAELFDNFNQVRAEQCSDICIITSKKQSYYTKENEALWDNAVRVVKHDTLAKGMEFEDSNAKGYWKAILKQPLSKMENGLQHWSARQPYMAASFLMLGAQANDVWNITIEGFQTEAMTEYLISKGLIEDTEQATLVVVMGYIDGVQYPYVGEQQHRLPVDKKFFIV